MTKQSVTVINDIQKIPQKVYQEIINQYTAYVDRIPFVKSVYQIGSVNNPGISDLDLVVVVDNCYNPLGMNQLSVRNALSGDLLKYIFAHDIYLYDCESFKLFNYTIHCDNLLLLDGKSQAVVEISKSEREVLSIQIIFDFISSRLAQFHSFLADGRLSLRGILLRVSSIKHSNTLLKNLGIKDKEIENFVKKVMEVRENPNSYSEKAIIDLFIASFYHFSRILHLAATYFAENYIDFYSETDASNTMKLNKHFILKFVDNAAEVYKNLINAPIIYYPKEVFYHYLAYTKYHNLIGRKARYYLSYSGGESYELNQKYRNTLGKRLDSISNQLIFLKKNKAYFAMGGNPGFVVDWETINTQKEDKEGKINITTISIPAVNNGQLKYNIIIDKVLNVEPLESLRDNYDFVINRLEIGKSDYEHWVLHFYPDWEKRFSHIYHKKLIELYATYSILNFDDDDTYMDVAGGINTYIHKINCKGRYMQSINVTNQLKMFLGNDIEYIESDAAKIPLPDKSLSKMSSHHSFEHFQDKSDVAFIEEIQRLLRVGGKCCIVPIFIADNYIEVTRVNKPHCHFDRKSRYIVDQTARITGGDSCGDYARIYDISSFQERIIDHIDRDRFRVTLSEISIDGQSLPDFTLPCHMGITKVNYPYRSLTVERLN